MKVKSETIIRTAILAVALINQILTIFGISVLPITDDQIATIISTIFTVGASVWAWWKNSSFTKEAIQADEYLAELKAQKKK